MSELSPIIRFIKNLCHDLKLVIDENDNGRIRIDTDQATGITLFLTIKNPGDFSFYFLERTLDMVYHGDRSDAHVILSLMFAGFLRASKPGISCFLYDIPHPAVEDEIWGRYIMPEQMPSLLSASDWEQLQEKITELLSLIAYWRALIWEILGCPCKDCLKRRQVEDLYQIDVSEDILKVHNKLYPESENINYSGRKWPDWSYIYNMNNEVTIIKSSELSRYFEAIQKATNENTQAITGINGQLIINGELNNFISNAALRIFNKVLKNLLQSTKPVIYKVLPMENMMVAVASPYIVAVGRMCGILEFRKEKELIRERHNEESKLLFPINKFEWLESPCPDQFEALIKVLLEREPNVSKVRKPAPLNQGDKGRDLLIEWSVINPGVLTQYTPPKSVINVVGQCKASNKTVGKDKVVDIRDTIDTHNAQGYFLAVSAQISQALTEKLESLQALNIWTEWWNRDDIELRLSKNWDLVTKFPKVLKVKTEIKFIEQPY